MIGETIILLDADGQASKMAAGCRRRVPKGARIVCSFGCQPGRAQHYVAAWDPVNIAARFMILHASAKDVLMTSYEQLHAERSETTEFVRRKLRRHIEAFFGDVSFDEQRGKFAHRASPSVKSMCIDSVSSRLLHSAWRAHVVPQLIAIHQILWRYGFGRDTTTCGNLPLPSPWMCILAFQQ